MTFQVCLVIAWLLKCLSMMWRSILLLVILTVVLCCNKYDDDDDVGLMHFLTGPSNGNLVCLPKKCVMLQLGHSNKHFKYNINNLVLPNVIEVKDLGIIVDHELKFKRHIQDNTTRAHSELHLYWDVLNLKILFYCSRHLWLPCDHSGSITARYGLLAMSRS